MHGIRSFEDLFADTGYVSLKNYLYNYLVRRHAVRKSLGNTEGEKILEVGSGISPMTEAGVDTRVVYSDVSLPSLLILKRAGGAGEHVAADGLRLPFRAGSFSTVVCSEVLEHMENDVQALQEIARILRPGGTLVITFPHRKAYFSSDDRFVHHYRRYEREGMEKLLRQADLAPVSTRKVLGPLEKLTMIAAVTVFSVLLHNSAGSTEGLEGMRAARIMRLLFMVANRVYAGLAWLDGRLSPRCLASVLLMKAVKIQ